MMMPSIPLHEKKKPPAMRQIDMTRALKAARAAGLTIAGFEIDPVKGRLVVNLGAKEALSPVGAADAAYQEWEAAHAARQNKRR